VLLAPLCPAQSKMDNCVDKNSVSEKLRELASNDINRSKAAQLRDVIDDVETALAAGVSRSSIIEILAEYGLEITLKNFDTTLARIRKTRKNQSILQIKTSPKETLIENIQTEKPLVASHDPADLNAIMNSTPDLEALAKFAKRNKK